MIKNPLDNPMSSEDDIENSDKDQDLSNAVADQDAVTKGKNETSEEQAQQLDTDFEVKKPLVNQSAAMLAEGDRTWLRNLFNTGNRGLKRVLIGTIASLVLSVGIFVLMLGAVSTRLSDVDIMLGALTTRAVKLNSVLESFDDFNETLVAVVESQDVLAKEQKELSEAINSLNQDGPDATKKAIAVGTRELRVDFLRIKEQVQSQASGLRDLSTAVTKFGTELTAFDVKISGVETLKASVDALITLEKEQYISVLERQAKIQAAQSGQQLPRVPRDTDMIFFSDKTSN
tara:strand:+ start:7653 stop:8516 length:864 start_codon:yes stop_codon:yes gene_type:complete